MQKQECLCVHTVLRVFACMCVCRQACVFMCACHACVCVYVCSYMLACVCVCTCVCTSVLAWLCILLACVWVPAPDRMSWVCSGVGDGWVCWLRFGGCGGRSDLSLADSGHTPVIGRYKHRQIGPRPVRYIITSSAIRKDEFWNACWLFYQRPWLLWKAANLLSWQHCF